VNESQGICRKDRKSQHNKKWREKAISKGLCTGCGNQVVSGKTMCDHCLTRKSERRANLANNGMCIEGCGRSRNAKNKRCKICLLKNISKSSTGSVKSAKLLGMKLVRQKFRCPYTGIYIHIGNNASIDHIVPRSKGGTNDLENLEWVHVAVNTLKGDMDREEFVKYFDKFLVNAFYFRKKS
jgi:5-methylcytosine-specific restriction endonuclease McrA